MPRNANQSKSTNYSLDFIPTDIINVSGFSTALSNVNNGTRSSDNNLPFSWSVWFRSRNSSNSQGEIAGYGQAQRNGIRIHNNVFRSNYTSDLAGTTTISQNVWYHGVVTYDGTTRIIYINGSLDASDTPSSAAISSQALTIGVYPGGTSSFNGDLNELCYFDYALSPSQVTTLWGGGTSVSNPMALSSPPIAYYPLGTSAYNGEYLAENNAIGDYVFDFNNSQDINCGNNSALQMDRVFTMSCWINTTSTSRGSIMGTYISNGYYIDLMASGTVQGGYHSTGSHFLRPSSSTVNDGNWHHICYVISGTATDGSDLNVYVDGQLNNGSFTYSGTPSGAVTTNPFKINLSGYSGRYTGETSNVQLFNTALSATDVETLYNYGSPIRTLANIPQNSNLKAWYKLDASATYNSSTTTWTIPDDSTNSNDGTSSGMTQANLVQSDLQTVAPYSKYAMSFDGIDDTMLLGSTPIVTGVFTISIWIKRTSTTSPESATSQYLIQKDAIGGGRVYTTSFTTATGEINFYVWTSAGAARQVSTSTVINDTEWHNVVFVNNGDTINNQVYLDGAEASYTVQDLGVSTLNSLNIELRLGGSSYYAPANFYGSMSNISMWTSAFSSFQVREIYNEGLPSNLNLHSSIGSIASWWQCGENSSFDGSNWRCVNEVASNNGVTRSMPVGALVNGVGTTANGVSSGMSEGNLVGDAPYSTANAISSGMAVQAFDSASPPNVISGRSEDVPS